MKSWTNICLQNSPRKFTEFNVIRGAINCDKITLFRIILFLVWGVFWLALAVNIKCLNQAMHLPHFLMQSVWALGFGFWHAQKILCTTFTHSLHTLNLHTSKMGLKIGVPKWVLQDCGVVNDIYIFSRNDTNLWSYPVLRMDTTSDMKCGIIYECMLK